MTFTIKDLIPGMSQSVASAIAERNPQLQTDLDAYNAQNDANHAPADPLETAKPLDSQAPDGTPTPSPLEHLLDDLNPFSCEATPQGPPRSEAGRTGRDPATGQWRLPNGDEHIRDDNIIWPDAMWFSPAPKNKKRKLAPLETLPDVQRELAKLYADYHHGRIVAEKFTKGVYGLTSLATVIKMEQKFDQVYAAKLREAIRN